MSPSQSLSDSVDCTFSHPKLFGKFTSRDVDCFNHYHLFFGKLGRMPALSPWVASGMQPSPASKSLCGSPFLVTVPNVVINSPKEQVLDIDTEWSITGVANDHPVRNVFVGGEYPCQPMSRKLFPGYVDSTISITGSCPGPHPAFFKGSLFNSTLEPCRYTLSFSHDDLLGVVVVRDRSEADTSLHPVSYTWQAA